MQLQLLPPWWAALGPRGRPDVELHRPSLLLRRKPQHGPEPHPPRVFLQAQTFGNAARGIAMHGGLQKQSYMEWGLNFFILDSRRDLHPAPEGEGAGIQNTSQS